MNEYLIFSGVKPDLIEQFLAQKQHTQYSGALIVNLHSRTMIHKQ